MSNVNLEVVELENILREVSTIASGVKNKSTYGSNIVTLRRSEMMERAGRAKVRLVAVLEHMRANTACTGLDCTCGKCEPLEGNEEFCKFTRKPIPSSQ